MKSSRNTSFGTQIDICVRSDSLELEHLSHFLDIKPTSGFEKGESYVGRQKCGLDIVQVERSAPTGVWHFCTDALLESSNVQDHAKFLLDTLRPAKAAFQQLMADPEYNVKITIWVSGYSCELTTAYLSELCSYAEEISISCWYDNEEDPE